MRFFLAICLLFIITTFASARVVYIVNPTIVKTETIITKTVTVTKVKSGCGCDIKCDGCDCGCEYVPVHRRIRLRLIIN